MRRSGLLLILCGLVAVAFFALSDPRVSPHWIEPLGWRQNSVDAAFDATAGSVIGLAGSLVMILIGLWLVVRRSA